MRVVVVHEEEGRLVLQLRQRPLVDGARGDLEELDAVDHRDQSAMGGQVRQQPLHMALRYSGTSDVVKMLLQHSPEDVLSATTVVPPCAMSMETMLL